MSTSPEPRWKPMPPYADPPLDPLPSGARALLNRLDDWAERMVAKYPALAEAIRRDAAAAEASAAD